MVAWAEYNGDIIHKQEIIRLDQEILKLESEFKHIQEKIKKHVEVPENQKLMEILTLLSNELFTMDQITFIINM